MFSSYNNINTYYLLFIIISTRYYFNVKTILLCNDAISSIDYFIHTVHVNLGRKRLGKFDLVDSTFG